MPYTIRNKIQRIKRGYSTADIYDVSYYLINLIPNLISDFEKQCFSYPIIQFEELDKIDYNWILQNYSEIIELLKKQDKNKTLTLDELTKKYSLDNSYIQWRLILRRIVYCLTQSSEDKCKEVNEYKDEYFEQAFGKKGLLDNLTKTHNGYTLKMNLVDPKLQENYIKRGKEIDNYRRSMKKEGFELLSNYFYSIWN